MLGPVNVRRNEFKLFDGPSESILRFKNSICGEVGEQEIVCKRAMGSMEDRGDMLILMALRDALPCRE